MNSRELVATATNDGINMADLLKTLQSGLFTFEVVFDSLEKNYRPFLNEFKTEFFRRLQ